MLVTKYFLIKLIDRHLTRGGSVIIFVEEGRCETFVVTKDRVCVLDII